MSTGRSGAEQRAKEAVDDTDGVPLGTASLRRDRDDTNHWLIRFPYQIVDGMDLDEGEELEQYYDQESGELRIPIDE